MVKKRDVAKIDATSLLEKDVKKAMMPKHHRLCVVVRYYLKNTIACKQKSHFP